MAFFEELGKKVSNVGKEVSMKAQNMSDISKLNSEITKYEKEISSAYFDLGRLFYEEHKDDLGATHREVISKINENYQKIDQLKSNITTIKAVTTCSHCGKENSKNALFCVGCGERLIPEQPKEQPQSIEGKFCPVCGTLVPENNKFCNKCGSKFEEA